MIGVSKISVVPFQTFLSHSPTPITLEDAPNFAFAVDDGDLYCIKRINTGSGMLEVHVLSGNKYRKFSEQRATPITLEDAPNFAFAVDDGDLYCIKRTNTGSGMLEVHVLSGNEYGVFSEQRATPITLEDAPNFAFAVDDGDLYCIKHTNTGSGVLEVHVLSGSSTMWGPYIPPLIPFSPPKLL